MKSRAKFLCIDCRVDTGKIGEFYFIKTNIWLEVVNGINGMLCIGCLETRLGRELTSSDFTDAYINSPTYGSKSQRLMERLTCTPKHIVEIT
jgi:hypothetical protein